MASETDTDVQCVGKNIPRTSRKSQKHLRSAGLAYVSRTGKIIPAKQVVELCQCPQKCNDRVSYTYRERLFEYFYHTLADADSQNKFLRNHMDVRPRLNLPPISDVPRLPGTRPPRRITCKYLIPLLPAELFREIDEDEEEEDLVLDHDTLEICQKAFCNAFVISTKRVRLQREKLIHSLGLNSYHHQKNLKKKPVEQELPLFLDKYKLEPGEASSEMEINRVQLGIQVGAEPMDLLFFSEQKNKKCLVNDPLIPFGISVPEGVTIAPVTATPDHDRDIAIVNNFFSNQLWKPEYIGTYS